jgi:hypothetical protein
MAWMTDNQATGEMARVTSCKENEELWIEMGVAGSRRKDQGRALTA